MASIMNLDKQHDKSVNPNGASVSSLSSMDPELQAIQEEIDHARKLTDLRATIERLKNWVVANPRYRELTYPVFEQLYRREEGAREAIAEAARMGLSAAEQEQRERLSELRFCVRAEDAPEEFRSALSDARQALREWKSVHSDDPILPVLNEHLDMEEEIAAQLHAR